MTKWMLPLLVAVATTSGCVVYENGHGGSSGWTREGGGPGADDSGAGGTDAAPDYTLTLDPAGAVPGSTVIVSLYGEGDIDLSTVTDVTFYGQSGLQVLATDTRSSNEFLMTIAVPAGAALGDNDMLVTLADGTAAYVKVAFTVVSDPSQIPPSNVPAGAGGCQ
jgi:hypothetical protein